MKWEQMKWEQMKWEQNEMGSKILYTQIKYVYNILKKAMIMENLCPPAILYVAFSLTHIILDVFKNMYNTAFIKFIIMIIFTIVLNVLCKNGLGVVSWIIVFIPFISMTIITSLLLMVLGLSPSTGNSSQDNNNNRQKNKTEGIHKHPYQPKKI